MHYERPNRFCYVITQAVAWVVAKLIFRRKFLRNEIRGKKGPFVVIANHQCALDFVNLIGATSRRMTFVISNSFFNTLPIRGFMRKLGVIPKQQFQTASRDLKRMKSVIDKGEAFVIYPAGLMCEDGLSTPIPAATYKFLKWLKVDVYAARASGSYFVMPKWAKGLRPGRTYMDIYKLFSAQELETMDLTEIREKTDAAMLFDAYREQEQLQIKYKNNQIVEGLEHVLYWCPHCKQEHTIVAEKNILRCTACGFTQESDDVGILHRVGDVGEEIPYVSDWSSLIFRDMQEKLRSGQLQELSAPVNISMIDMKKKKFIPVGQGELRLNTKTFRLCGQVNGETLDLTVDAATYPSLPFSPGKYLEFQYGDNIYRCMPQDGRLVMKFINMIKALYARAHEYTEADKQAV